MKIELFYDKECPFCKSYANYIKLKEKHELILLNARDETEQIKLFRKKRIDINDGFIIRVDNQTIYQGANAIIYLNKLANKKVFFPNNIFFKKILYPLIKTLRKVVLFLLAKKSKL